MRYLSVCSGIEAATTAWHPLGWQPAAFAEIEPFPSAVLAHHWPEVPNLGDMTQHHDWPERTGPIQLLVGGTPCQAFSVAGLRQGLADPRGNLTLTYLALVAQHRPTWVVWENVPGVLSDKTGAFGSFLGGLAELGYGWAYRVLDAQYYGVAQRRRRVFVVGCLGNWGAAAAVLFERESLLGHPPPRRTTWESPASGFECGPMGGSLTDLAPTLDTRCKDEPIRNQLGAGVIQDTRPHHTTGAGYWQPGFSTLRAREQDSHENLITHTLKGEGFDASEDGTGRGTPLVPCVSPTLRAGGNKTGGDRPPGTDVDTCESLIPVAFDTTQITSAANRSHPKPGDPCHPLAAGAHPPAIATYMSDPMQGQGFQPPIAFPERLSGTQCASTPDLSPSLQSHNPTAIATYLSDVQGHGSQPPIAFSGRARGDDGRGYDRPPQVFGEGPVGALDTVKPHCVAFSCKDHGADAGELAPTLRSMNHDGSHANGGGQVAIAFERRMVRTTGGQPQEELSHCLRADENSGDAAPCVAIQEAALRENPSSGPQGKGFQNDLSFTLEARNALSKQQAVATAYAVRRLTPRECERLQGFPDDHTLIPWRGKLPTDCPDVPRYKAIGNSMAVPVMAWIGQRIQLVHDLFKLP